MIQAGAPLNDLPILYGGEVAMSWIESEGISRKNSKQFTFEHHRRCLGIVAIGNFETPMHIMTLASYMKVAKIN